MSSIPISAVAIGPEEEALVLDVLRSGHLAQGPMVERLETEFTALAGARHAVAVSSGTVALVAALEALGIGPGDEVITSPFTFVATLNAILERGATARFAEIDPADFTVRPDAVEALVNERTAAILPVHLYGQPAAMPELTAIAERHSLALVEDAAQAHGATVADRPVGSYGVGCFSLYATKNLTTGEGGVVTTNDDDVADRLRLLRNQGMRQRYQYEVAGHNWRMTDVQAAIGLPQLARLEGTTARRRVNAAALSSGLAGVPGLVTPVTVPGRTHVFHQYTLRVLAASGTDRDELARRLGARGVGSGIYYPKLVHNYDCYRGHPLVATDPTPDAARVATEVLSLPVHPLLDTADLEIITKSTREALR